jgi:hypothetical protein
MSFSFTIKIIGITGVLRKKVVFQITKGSEKLSKVAGFRDNADMIMDFNEFLKMIQPNTDIEFDLKNKKVRDGIYNMRPV